MYCLPPPPRSGGGRKQVLLFTVNDHDERVRSRRHAGGDGNISSDPPGESSRDRVRTPLLLNSCVM